VFLGSIELDYFDNEPEAMRWASDLRYKGYDAKYIGMKNGKYVVQKNNMGPKK
jgi:hypothetical protein